MTIPKKYEKYNILPESQKEDIEVFEMGKWVLEGDYQICSTYKIPYSICPTGAIGTLENYYEFLEELRRRCLKVKDINSLIDKMKKEMKYLNDKEKWTVLRYKGNDDDEFEPGKYYFCTYYESGIKWAHILRDGEERSSMYPFETSEWEVVEDPRGWFGENPPTVDDINFKYE